VVKKSQEYADKQEQDQSRYQQLFDEMQQEQDVFKKKLGELTFHQKKILEEMDHENTIQIDELKREEQDLFALSKALREQNLKERD
jgi:effector-binding domain-containing protein